jgi:hypothetical protein
MLEAIAHFFSLFLGRAVVEKQRLLTERAFQMGLVMFALFGKLGEYQGLIALIQQFFNHFVKAS